MNSRKEYKKLHKEIEILIKSRLESILSQLDLDDTDIEKIINLNEELSKINTRKKTLKNISGYNLFVREMFPEVKNNNQNIPTKDILKIIANFWKEQDIKEDYNKRAKFIKPKIKKSSSKRKNKDIDSNLKLSNKLVAPSSPYNNKIKNSPNVKSITPISLFKNNRKSYGESDLESIT